MDVNQASDILGVDPNAIVNEPLIGGDVLGMGEGLFDDFTEDDLAIPEKVLFTAGEEVTVTIVDFRKTKIGFSADFKVETGEHKGKVIDYTVFDPKTSKFEVNRAEQVNFKMYLLAIWTKEEILGKTASEENAIGRKITFTAKPMFTRKNGEQDQSYSNFKAYKEEETNNVGL